MVRKTKSSKHLHVYWNKWAGKWEARIKSLGVYLKLHPTEDAAHMAVEKFLNQWEGK